MGLFKKSKQKSQPTAVVNITESRNFTKWLEKGIEELGEGTGFGFNLYEGSDCWTVDFAKSNYDANDEDWFAINQTAFFPNENTNETCVFAYHNEVNDWEESLVVFANLLRVCYDESKAFRELSKKAKIVFGHHDGDLYSFEEAFEGKITRDYVSLEE